MLCLKPALRTPGCLRHFVSVVVHTHHSLGISHKYIPGFLLNIPIVKSKHTLNAANLLNIFVLAIFSMDIIVNSCLIYAVAIS